MPDDIFLKKEEEKNIYPIIYYYWLFYQGGKPIKTSVLQRAESSIMKQLMFGQYYEVLEWVMHSE